MAGGYGGQVRTVKSSVSATSRWWTFCLPPNMALIERDTLDTVKVNILCQVLCEKESQMCSTVQYSYAKP
jgi:hypothetical protein